VAAGESITGMAQLLGMAEAVVGDYGWYETVLDRLQAVTLDDLARVCASYLHKRNRTVGWYEPDENAEWGEEDEAWAEEIEEA
jgi:zinc protease